MLRFIGDMFIGWILFTDTGKKTINSLVNKAYKHVQSNVLKSTQLKELISLKDIFIKGNDDVESIANNGTKN